tara:strand:+ start:232 stop:405 length:174 start_codon:yes stop_codon:yes gene_type:complete
MKQTASQQCWEAGINGLAELARITKVPLGTLKDWHKSNQVKFKVAIDAALHRKLKGE